MVSKSELQYSLKLLRYSVTAKSAQEIYKWYFINRSISPLYLQTLHYLPQTNPRRYFPKIDCIFPEKFPGNLVQIHSKLQPEFLSFCYQMKNQKFKLLLLLNRNILELKKLILYPIKLTKSILLCFTYFF